MFLRGAGVSTIVLIGLAGLAGPAAAQISQSAPPGYAGSSPSSPEGDGASTPSYSASPVDVRPLPPPSQEPDHAPPPQSGRAEPAEPEPPPLSQYGRASPAESEPAPPAQYGRADPAEPAPDAPAQYGRPSPTEPEPTPPAQYGRADPAEPAPDAPAEYGRASPAEPELDPQPPRAFEPADAYSRPAYGIVPAPLRPPGPVYSNLPPEERPELGPTKAMPPQFRRTEVDYRTREPAGTIVVDTPNTYLYLVLGNGRALRYGIGVGREGFTWSGTERVSRMAEWPDWYPPAEMIERQPYLPRWMAGGEGNPLGARALYLGKTLYRIHGTNQPSTIGSFVSSGCIRLTNDDVADLYSRVQVGTRVVVLTGPGPATASAAPVPPSGGSTARQAGSAAQPAPYNPLAPPPRR